MERKAALAPAIDEPEGSDGDTLCGLECAVCWSGPDDEEDPVIATAEPLRVPLIEIVRAA